VYLSHARTWISNMLSELRWAVIVRFVDIGEFIDHHVSYFPSQTWSIFERNWYIFVTNCSANCRRFIYIFSVITWKCPSARTFVTLTLDVVFNIFSVITWNCPGAWTFANGRCYRTYPNIILSYSVALNLCNNQDATLVTFETEVERVTLVLYNK
jgi:hypothetical protein